MTSQDEDPEPLVSPAVPVRRPLVLTITCVIGWILVVVAAIRVAARWDALAHLPGGRAAAGILALVVLLAVMVGYWQLRRWGLWLLAGALVVRLGAAAIGSLPIQASDLVLPIALLAVGLVYLRRLH